MRNPNQNASRAVPTVTYRLWNRHREYLHRYESGGGGYQQFVTELCDMLDNHPQTVGGVMYYVELGDEHLGRLTRYIHSYGSGGPQSALRKAFARYFTCPDF